MFHLHSHALLPADAPLPPGRHELVCQQEGQYRLQVVEPDSPLSRGDGEVVIRWDVSERDLWLRVVSPRARIHLNGRPIARLARVRSGDVLHVDGTSFQVHGRTEAALTPAALATACLRVHGGPWHGQALPLYQGLVLHLADAVPRLLPAERADAGCAVFRVDAGMLQMTVGNGLPQVAVNGEPVREAVLAANDQIDPGNGMRLVVETARLPVSLATEAAEEVPAGPLEPLVPDTPSRTLPWLLLAALAGAAVLGGLLLFGAR